MNFSYLNNKSKFTLGGYLQGITLGNYLVPEPRTYGSINPVASQLLFQHYFPVIMCKIIQIIDKNLLF